MKTIYDGDLKLATIIRKSDIAKGLNFYSEDADFIQVGTWNYDRGKRLADHIHNIAERTVYKTQEVIYVIQGAVKAFVYSENEKFIRKVYLYSGDTMIYWNGGHGYEIMEDNTLILEAKNGPFLGVEKDKRLINV